MVIHWFSKEASARVKQNVVFQQQQNLGRRFGASKIIKPPVTVRSKAVVLLIHCLLLLSLFCGGFVFGPCFVVQCSDKNVL